jgi:hypothetical protein
MRFFQIGQPMATVADRSRMGEGGAERTERATVLRDEHSKNMARKVVFSETTASKILPLNQSALLESPKTVPQAKAKYAYPWWASSKPMCGN